MIHAFKQIRLTNTDLVASGNRIIVAGQTGAFLSDLNNISGKLESTGSALQGQITSIRNNTGNYITGAIGLGTISIVSVGTGIITISGQGSAGGEANTASNLGNGVGVFSDKNGIDLRFFSLSGVTGMAVTRNGNQIEFNSTLNTGQFYPASNPSSYSTTTNVENTGTALQGQVNILTNNLTTTGTTLRNLIIGLSGQLDASGIAINNVKNSLNVFSGNSQNFSTGILPTGNSSYFIQFPLNFASIPKVLTTVEVSGSVIYSTAVQARSISGFFALFSDDIAESGVILSVSATINN